MVLISVCYYAGPDTASRANNPVSQQHPRPPERISDNHRVGVHREIPQPCRRSSIARIMSYGDRSAAGSLRTNPISVAICEFATRSMPSFSTSDTAHFSLPAASA
jgi:hypothetical protein